MRIWGIAIAIAVVAACTGDGHGNDPIDPDGVERCGEMPVLDVPIATARTGAPLHWPVARCIPVSVADLTDAQLAEVTAAIDAWLAVGCSALCFETPAAATEPFDARTTDGFYIAPARPASPTASSVVFETTGRIRAAAVGVAAVTSRGELIRQIGLGLGLDRPNSGVDSVLALDFPLAGATQPTALDGASLCALYGEPPLCE